MKAHPSSGVVHFTPDSVFFCFNLLIWCGFKLGAIWRRKYYNSILIRLKAKVNDCMRQSNIKWNSTVICDKKNSVVRCETRMGRTFFSRMEQPVHFHFVWYFLIPFGCIVKQGNVVCVRYRNELSHFSRQMPSSAVYIFSSRLWPFQSISDYYNLYMPFTNDNILKILAFILSFNFVTRIKICNYVCLAHNQSTRC